MSAPLLADAVHRHDRRLLERRRVERRGGVRLVVLAEQHLALVSGKPTPDVIGHPQLLAEPERRRHQVRAKSARRARHVRFEEAIQLDERLLVEADEIEPRQVDAGLAQAVLDRPRRKAGVVLLPREALLLRCCDDASVLDEAGGRVVVVGGDAENTDHLEECINEGRDGARLREDDQQAKHRKDDDDRQKPVLLLLPEELPELAYDSNFSHMTSVSEHAVVMLRIAVARRMRRPAGPRLTAARERIFANQAPHGAERHERDDIKDGEEHARIHVSKRA